MNTNIYINNILQEISKKTLKKLESLNIPPYPKYYYETFLDIMDNYDNPKIIDVLQNNPELFFEDKDSLILERFLELAKKSINEFQSSNNAIKHISTNNNIQLEDIAQDDQSEYAKNILTVCTCFHQKILKQIHIADKTINDMKKKIEQLENDSNLNSLTKLGNDILLAKDLGELIESNKENNIDIFLIIFDADDFKKINNDFGHTAGDKTLIYLGKLLKSLLRQGTRIYHNKDEKFSVILYENTEKKVREITHRILSEVSQSKLFYKGNNIHLTLSAGIAKYNKGETVETIIQRANEAIIEAKNAGKNCFKEAK